MRCTRRDRRMRRTLRPVIGRCRHGDTYGRRRGQRVRVTKRAARRRCIGSLLARERRKYMATRETPETPGEALSGEYSPHELSTVFREPGKTVKTDSFRFRETITATKRIVATHHNARSCPPRGVTRTLKCKRLPATPQV